MILATNHMTLAILATITLIFSASAEVVWVFWARSIDADSKHRVAVASLLISASSWISVWILVDERIMIVPALVGNVAGAYIGMAIKIKSPKTKEDTKQ